MNALLLYRMARQLQQRQVPFLPRVIDKLVLYFCRCVIPSRCEIGEGSELGYGGIAVVIHERVRIGKNVMIGPCVTLGGRSGIEGVPVIDDDVYIGTGAKILGDIHVGKRAVIGANAVVLESVPDDAVVAGVPARIIRIQSHRDVSGRHASG
jgi:serine O-acetyltransferase